MANITIYSTPFCPYCAMAKRLLTSKGADYEDINLFTQPGRRTEMLQRANGRHTVPQIFIDETHVGGFDDLQALDQAGKLDPMLSGAA